MGPASPEKNFKVLGTAIAIVAAGFAISHITNNDEPIEPIAPIQLADIPAKIYEVPQPHHQEAKVVHLDKIIKVNKAALVHHVSIDKAPKQHKKLVMGHISSATQSTLAESTITKPNSNTNSTHEELNDKTCSSFRRRANDIYMGIGCAEDGAKYEVVYSSTLEKGWVYSAIYVGGIYKCAYIRAGVLPEMQHHPKIVAACENYYDDLVNKRNVYFKDYNCPELRPGLEGCNGPTPPRGLTDKTPDDLALDGNFASDEPSPFNVLGTGGGGFSTSLPNEINEAVGYRVGVRPGSDEGQAIVVRDTNDTPSLDWGFTHREYVKYSDRHGGSPTN